MGCVSDLRKLVSKIFTYYTGNVMTKPKKKGIELSKITEKGRMMCEIDCDLFYGKGCEQVLERMS
jgi:hypothetical protein